MLWLWILLVLAALAALLSITRLGARITLGDTLCVHVTLGLFKLRVYPSGKAEAPEAKQARRRTGKKKEGTRKKGKKPLVLTKADIQEGVRVLWPVLRRALGRTRRGVRLSPLTLSAAIPGRDDPAWAAALYGRAGGAVWTVMPVLEQLLDIPTPSIHMGLDFDRSQWLFRGQVGVTFRVGTLLRLGFGTAIPIIRWFFKIQKEHARSAPKPQPAAAAADRAA